MSAIQQQKEELRREILASRDTIPEEVWKRKSDQLVSQLMETDLFLKAQKIHCYVSMNQRREVNTHSFIKKLLAADKEVYVPVTNFEDGTLSHVRLHSFDDLSPNIWGVLEPTDAEKVHIDVFDLIIVPMVAADKQGNRLGYGKGFYDRFLSHTEGIKVGLVFERFVQKEIPTEDFDVKLDVLITNKGILKT
ncbi:MAG: 5-formyltetrahydrofolate cyclo-ligase [Balneolaceae bacterium]|nr:5-formyltetrahydrofolate cyclo-ligase [Balneolaceae bacterium]